MSDEPRPVPGRKPDPRNDPDRLVRALDVGGRPAAPRDAAQPRGMPGPRIVHRPAEPSLVTGVVCSVIALLGISAAAAFFLSVHEPSPEQIGPEPVAERIVVPEEENDDPAFDSMPPLRPEFRSMAEPPPPPAAGPSDAPLETAPAEPAPGDAARADAADLPPPSSLVPDRIERTLILDSGDTVMALLLRAGLSRGEAYGAIQALGEHVDLRRLRPGQALELDMAATPEGGRRLRALRIKLDGRHDLTLTREPDDGFRADLSVLPVKREIAVARSAIEGSFYLAGYRAEVPSAVLAELTRVFSWDVDFQRDLRAGDGFEVLYERELTEDGTLIGTGEVLYARLDLSDREVEAFAFDDGDGLDYYTREGKTLRKSLMRTPLDGGRLTSGYGMRRHPILGYNRLHKGVDFAAPTGTPVFAAGDGRVVERGRKGGYGNYVRIRHNGEYSTAYAHLNGFHPDLERGDRVKQGDVIGFVGSTGRSTGPHLHFEVHQDGRAIDPLTARQVNLAELSAEAKTRLAEQVREIDALRRRGDDGETVIAQVERPAGATR